MFLSSVFTPLSPRALFGDSDDCLSLPGAVLREVHGDSVGSVADEGAFWKDFVEEVTGVTSSWRRRHSPSWVKKRILVGEGKRSDSSQDFEFGWRSHSLRLECFYLTSLSWMFASLSLVSVCTGLL